MRFVQRTNDTPVRIAMHHHDTSTDALTEAIVRYAVDRTGLDPPPLDHPRRPDELRAMVGETITERGIGAAEALRLFADVLGPACISLDHPRFLSFVPAAPTRSSILFDLVVGASSIYAGDWMEGAGAVFAENLRPTSVARGVPRKHLYTAERGALSSTNAPRVGECQSICQHKDET